MSSKSCSRAISDVGTRDSSEDGLGIGQVRGKEATTSAKGEADDDADEDEDAAALLALDDDPRGAMIVLAVSSNEWRGR